MNAIEFEAKLEKSMGLKLIIAGLAGLVEDEGYTPREAFEMLTVIKRNTFHALQEISKESRESNV